MVLHYKGFTANVEWSKEDGVYVGIVTGISDSISFECKDGRHRRIVCLSNKQTRRLIMLGTQMDQQSCVANN